VGGPKKIVVVQPRQQQQRKRRVVTFAEDDRVEVFEKDYNHDDKRNIWYTAKECQNMKSEIYRMVKFANMQESQVLDSDSQIAKDIEEILSRWNWRGLDHLRRKQSRKEIRKLHARDLLHFTRFTKCSDPVQLGIFSANNSTGSVQRARQLGLLDEQEALEIYNDDNVNVNADWDGVDVQTRMKASSDKKPKQNKKPVHIKEMSICKENENCETGQSVQNMFSLRISSPYQMLTMLLPCVYQH